MQEIFSASKFGFEWVRCDDGSWWYSWEPTLAEKAARQARDARAKELVAQGKKVKKFSLGKQLITRGGIGTPYPQIEFHAACYGLNVL